MGAVYWRLTSGWPGGGHQVPACRTGKPRGGGRALLSRSPGRGRIRHKNIIEVFDVGVSPQGEPFLVMEYLEGESLAGLLKRTGPLNLGAACA